MPKWHAARGGKSWEKPGEKKPGKTEKNAETPMPKPLRKDYKCNQVKRRKQTIKIVLSAKAEKASSSSIKRRATEEKGIPPLFHFSTFPHRMSRRSILSYCRLEIKTQSQVKFIKY